MGISEDFEELLKKLQLANSETISLRYGEVTSALKRKFRDTQSKTANSLRVGSIGRFTAINGVSNLDMIYIMPASKWKDYRSGGQYKLLNPSSAFLTYTIS